MDLLDLMHTVEQKTLPPLREEAGYVEGEAPTGDQQNRYVELLETALVGAKAAAVLDREARGRRA